MPRTICFVASFVIGALVTPVALLAQVARPGTLSTVPLTTSTVPPTTVPAQTASTKRLMGFSLALVEGSLKGASSTEGLSPAAVRAIADLKDFLPYKSYQHLDTQWILGSGNLSTRLQRPGQVYEAAVNAFTGPAAAQAHIVTVSRFVLRESGGTPALAAEGSNSAAVQAAERMVQSAQATARDVRAKFEIGIASRSAVTAADEAVLQRELQLVELRDKALADLAAQQSARATIINSSFKMEVGETLVVGTSRIAGDRALIILLTAVAR